MPSTKGVNMCRILVDNVAMKMYTLIDTIIRTSLKDVYIILKKDRVTYYELSSHIEFQSR